MRDVLARTCQTGHFFRRTFARNLLADEIGEFFLEMVRPPRLERGTPGLEGPLSDPQKQAHIRRLCYGDRLYIAVICCVLAGGCFRRIVAGIGECGADSELKAITDRPTGCLRHTTGVKRSQRARQALAQPTLAQAVTGKLARMTRASDHGEPTVPIGSAIVETLHVAGPQSATALARRLQLRKADVLVACRALAAACQIRRLGKRWALRPAARCAGLNKAGGRCARVAATGRSFCAQHEPDLHASPPRSEDVVPERAIPEGTPPMTARDVASPTPPREEAPACAEASDAAPELFVEGHRVTEADVIEALSMLGDERVQAYREGRLPKAEAYGLARNRLRAIGQMRGRIYRSPFRSSGHTRDG